MPLYPPISIPASPAGPASVSSAKSLFLVRNSGACSKGGGEDYPLEEFRIQVEVDRTQPFKKAGYNLIFKQPLFSTFVVKFSEKVKIFFLIPPPSSLFFLFP